VKIGTYTLDEPTEFTLYYEVAAWWTKILVPAGEYDITGQEYIDGTIKDTSVTIALEGEVIENHTPALFGGVAYGGSNKDKYNGEIRTKHISPYAHAVAKQAVEGSLDPRWQLNDRVTPQKVYFYSTIDGEQRHTYKLQVNHDA
jgi:hypothetical protein